MITKCPICGKKFVKISKYIWKPSCDCVGDHIRLAKVIECQE